MTQSLSKATPRPYPAGLAGLLGLYYALSGFTMVLDPQGWWNRIPGIEETGGYNAHFITDIGIAFMASAAGLLWAAWALLKARPAAGALLPATIFVTGHALFHIVEGLLGDDHATDLLQLIGIQATGFATLLLFLTTLTREVRS